MKRLFLLLFAALYLPAAQKPPKSSMVSLERLPTELKNLILLQTSVGPNGILNIPALAQGITMLAATNKALHSLINNPKNILIILKSLPKAGAKVLASCLGNMPGMKSKEVQDWLKSIKLEGGQELYEAIHATPPNVNAILKMIEKPNIDVNWNKNNDKLSALMLISETEYKEIAKTLLATGANVTMRDIFGDTPLMHASRRNRADMVQLLLAAGAPINTKNKYGWTALRMAGENGLSQIVMSLLAAGADPFIKDSKGKSVLEIARFEARYHPHQPQADRYNVTIKLLEDAEKAQKEMAGCK